MTKRTAKVGDKVHFSKGWGTVIAKRLNSSGFGAEYEVQLEMGESIETADGWIDDMTNRGQVYIVQHVELAN